MFARRTIHHSAAPAVLMAIDGTVPGPDAARGFPRRWDAPDCRV